jgi:hypothetical protein
MGGGLPLPSISSVEWVVVYLVVNQEHLKVKKQVSQAIPKPCCQIIE